MPDDLVVDKIRKSSHSEIWVTTKEYEGRPFCDIREYFYSSDGPQWLPTKKGVSIPRDFLGRAVDAVEELASKNEVGEVAVLQRSKRQRIRFAIREYEKHVFGEIRIYYTEDPDGSDWKPGKGVTLPLALLGKLAEALKLAEDQMESG
jgi:hypothetical protein